MPFFTVVLLGVAFNSNAQTTTLTTGTTGDPLTFLRANSGPHAGETAKFITFDVINNNPCPIAVTNVNNLHIGSQPFGNPLQFTLSNNDSSYNLYYSLTSLTGFPSPVTQANGWNFVRNSGPINTGTTNGIASVFDSIEIVIPANSRARFLVQTYDTMGYIFNSVPVSVSSNGVTLESGTTNIYGGYWPATTPGQSDFNVLQISPQPISLNFIGSITTKQLAPIPPTAPFSLKPINKCIGADLVLKATHPKTGGFFTWRDAAGNIISRNTTGDTTITNLQLSNAGKYYVTYELCGQESDPDSIVLIMRNPPAPTVSGKFDYCLNEQFEPITVNGNGVKWYYDPTGGSPVPVTPTINTSSPNTLIYYVSQTDQYGCESIDRTLVRYRAAAQPFPPFVNTPIYYCEEAVADELTAVGDTLRWYYEPVGGVPTTIAPTPNTSVNKDYKYYVTQTIDGCESERSKIEVIVTFRPNGLIVLDKDVICAGDEIIASYYGSAELSSQYNWSLPTGSTRLNDGKDQDPLRLRLDSAGTQEIKLRVGNTGCLSDLYIEEILVKPLPFGDILQSPDVCLGQPELIESTNYTPGLDTFIWDFDGGLTTHFTTDQGPYGVFWDTEGVKSVKLTFIHNECVTTIFDTITVHPKPSAKIVADIDAYDGNSRQFGPVRYVEGDTMCASDSLKVTVETVEPGATYKWTPARFFDTYTDLPVTYARVDFSNNIYVEVEDIYGCQNKDSIKVATKSCCEMTFPSAFSPNNDGKNDRFRPITVGRRQVKTYRVMNRYGQTVYESNMSGQGWDGNMNGKPADIGTYFYLISFDCDGKNVDQAGEVILVR